MLDAEDKNWLKKFITKAVREAVVEELTVEIDWERHRDEKTGQPLPHPERTKEKIFLPSFFCQHLKFHEGAFRGSQETLDKVTNVTVKTGEKLEELGKAFVQIEDPMLTLTRFVQLLARTRIMDRLEEIATIDIEHPAKKQISAAVQFGGENEGDHRQP